MAEVIFRAEKDEGEITVSIDDENFVIEAARTKPKPLVDTLINDFGVALKAAYSHPRDTSIPVWFTATLFGYFDAVSPKASDNAKQVYNLMSTVIRANVSTSSWDNFILSVKIMVLYYQTQTRGELLARMGARYFSGRFITPYIFSFGGRINKQNVRKIATVLACLGAIIRISTKMWENKIRIEEVSFYPILNSVITGDNRIISVPHEIGIDNYFKLRSYLIAHPEAIQINDLELNTLKFLFEHVDKFLKDPLIVKQWIQSK